jgi:hypothetical protein
MNELDIGAVQSGDGLDIGAVEAETAADSVEVVPVLHCETHIAGPRTWFAPVPSGSL